MKPASKLTQTAALFLLAAAALPAQAPPVTQIAQTAPAPHLYVNHNNLFLDPAHGGSDEGARIGDRLLEKDLTLALANRIRTQLGDQPNLNLIVTRESEIPGAPAPDQPAADLGYNSRAGMANHARPFGCVLLHATAAGSGVHIVTSELALPDPNAPSTPGTPWNTAQAIWVGQSLRLANQIGTALQHAGVPVYLTHASVRPLDSLTCPAIAIELAPPRLSGNPSTIADPSYQQRVATAIATGLIFWRSHAEPLPAVSATAPAAKPPDQTAKPQPAQPSTPATPPASREKATPDPGAPIVRRLPTQPDAPVIRRPPPTSEPEQMQPTPPPPGAQP